jgi:soluble lytic murein transglycosylase
MRGPACVVALWAVCFAAAASEPAGDGEFLAAREAFRVGDQKRLELAAGRLRGHLLEPYVVYWQFRPRVADADPADVQAVLDRLADSPLSDRLRNDWLKALARRNQWDTFEQAFPGLVAPDVDNACAMLARRAGRGDADAVRDARTLWLAPRAGQDACDPLFAQLAQARRLNVADVWARFRLSLEAGQLALAKRALDYLPPGTPGPDPRTLDAIFANPQGWLERKGFDLATRGGREAVLFAVHRMARTAPRQAAAQWSRIADRFAPEEREYAWGQLATFAAQRHDPDALDWFARAGRLADHQLAWKARAAMRSGLWVDVQAAIDAMSDRETDPAWRYWKARALREQGRVEASRSLLAPLSQEFSFYGFLALEDLGGRVAVPAADHKASKSEIQAVAGMPAIRRALALFQLQLRTEAVREWFWGTRGFDDHRLLAAAELARSHGLWDRAINTAERTERVHDFELRYLAPHRELFASHAQAQALETAWVLGLVRQESRFIVDARSSAGASGLMQLMPATARWVAGKLGLKDYQPSRVTDLDTNVSLGTYYLKHVFETLDNHPVLASAAYNAGPGRARAWRPGSGGIEGAIYTESIPFNETRDYVKKVMANATVYAQVLGERARSLRERIGFIPPRARDREPSLSGEP